MKIYPSSLGLLKLVPHRWRAPLLLVIVAGMALGYYLEGNKRG